MKFERQIAVSDQTKLIDFQREFNSIYPYLRIEFSIPQLTVPDKNNRIIILKNQTLADVGHFKNEKIIILPLITVSELVQQFRELFNTNIHIFRKSGKAWLEITGTDGWTLTEQNLQGAALSINKN